MTLQPLMEQDLLATCRWPELAEPHAGALHQAVEFILAETSPIGIIATGTVVRGEAHPASDIDLYVVHEAAYRRRVQRFFNHVPTEIFINPPSAVRSYFPSEHRDGRRYTAHMIATGVVILDGDPVIERLRARLGHAHRIADRTLEARGFFEWDSGPEPVR